MTNFIYDNTSPGTAKTDLVALPGGADATKYIAAADWEVFRTALADIQTVMRSNGVGQYGDGSDGNVVISVDTTLTRDMYYNNLTVNVGIKLLTANFRVYVKGLLTLNGTITAKGNAGTNSNGFGAPGGTAFAGSMPPNGAGGQGGRNSAGNPGASVVGGVRGATNSGGAGGAATNAAGAAGTNTVGSAASGDLRSLPSAMLGRFPSAPQNTISTSAGGGSGASATAGGDAGGGGAGGGWLAIAAKLWTGAGSLVASGGDAGTPGGTGAVGGSGGGAGGIITCATSLPTIPTTDVTGGLNSSGINGGANGTAGGAGLVINLSNT